MKHPTDTSSCWWLTTAGLHGSVWTWASFGWKLINRPINNSHTHTHTHTHTGRHTQTHTHSNKAPCTSHSSTEATLCLHCCSTSVLLLFSEEMLCLVCEEEEEKRRRGGEDKEEETLSPPVPLLYLVEGEQLLFNLLPLRVGSLPAEPKLHHLGAGQGGLVRRVEEGGNRGGKTRSWRAGVLGGRSGRC